MTTGSTHPARRMYAFYCSNFKIMLESYISFFLPFTSSEIIFLNCNVKNINLNWTPPYVVFFYNADVRSSQTSHRWWPMFSLSV